MKKLKPITNPTEQSFGIEDFQDPYEIIYADRRDEEIQLQILKDAQLTARMARWSLDMEYNQYLWSDGVYEILEIDPKKSGASFDTFLGVIHPEDRIIKQEAQQALYKTKSPLEITYRLQLNDGRIKWINEICSADFDQHEKPTRFYGIIQDITRYKLSERKFRQKEKSYKALINALPIGIAIFQNDKFTYINPAGIHLLGAESPNEIIGQPITQFVQRNSIKHFQEKMNEAGLVTGVSTFEEKLIRGKESVFDATITAIPISINETPAIQAVIIDVSDKKSAAEAFNRSEEKFRLLTVHLAEIVWIVNTEGIVTYVSPYEENILGYPVEQVLKNRVSKFLSPGSVMTCLIEWEELKSIDQSASKMEARKIILESLGKDKKTKWLEVTNTALFDSDGHFIGFSGIGQDITKRKEAELTLKENEQLKQRELQLKEIVETKDKFISIIAHDLRSPFNSMIGFLELLLNKYDEFSESERKEHISLILENAISTLNLLENLLVWAKSQTGKITFHPVKQQLIPILNQLKENFSLALIHKKLELKIISPKEFEIFADSHMLSSLFQNLISNAIKYSKPGGSILIDVREIPNQIEIMVSDTGIGMSQETMNRLFKVGEDISNPGTYNEKGSGLGLILCKDFVERHGGSIFVKSELGKGSQFVIRIPQIGESAN